MDNLHSDVSASVLSKRFLLKESELLLTFKLHTGVTVEEFVLRRRIERALQLLKSSNASDGEIAMGVGWGAASAFQTAFIAYLGVSPAEYRKSLLPKEATTNVGKRKRPCKAVCEPRQASAGRAFRAFLV